MYLWVGNLLFSQIQPLCHSALHTHQIRTAQADHAILFHGRHLESRHSHKMEDLKCQAHARLKRTITKTTQKCKYNQIRVNTHTIAYLHTPYTYRIISDYLCINLHHDHFLHYLNIFFFITTHWISAKNVILSTNTTNFYDCFEQRWPTYDQIS